MANQQKEYDGRKSQDCGALSVDSALSLIEKVEEEGECGSSDIGEVCTLLCQVCERTRDILGA